jgi:hypothetical protein
MLHPRCLDRWCEFLLATTAVLSVVCQSAPARGQSPPDPARVKAVTALLSPQPQAIGRPLDDRTAWQAAAQLPGLKRSVAKAESLLKQPIPELTEDLYLDFSRTGNRNRCQAVISARHGRLPALVVAECLENRGRFLPGVEEAVRAICSERSWLLPAHDRGLQNYHGKTVEIDLNSAATSWNLALADAWLGDKLSRETRDLIRAELERRTFAPYEGYANRGRPRLWWATGTNNWNAVCLAGVTGAALAVIETPQRRAWFVAAAEKYVQHFLQGFTSDGYCSEGIGYYNYGFGHYVLLAETLHQATGGRVDLMEPPLVRQIAQFGPRMEIVPGIYPAFADCSPRARPDAELLDYLSHRYGFGWEDIERKAAAARGSPGSLFDLGVYGFPNSLSKRPAGKETPPAPACRDWFADAGILICRPRPDNRQGLGVGLKGGHNAEHHNHNDVGSYVVALAGDTPLLDPGAEVYTARTFSSKRYDSNVLNSYGHPVPRVAGQLQREGRQSVGKVLRTEFTDDQDTLALDIRSCYAVPSLQKLQRTFVFSRIGRGSLTVTDEVEFSAPQEFGTALITCAPDRQIDEQTLVFGEGAGAVRVEVTAQGGELKIGSEELHEDVHGPLPVRLGLDFATPIRKATITVTIAPANQ